MGGYLAYTEYKDSGMEWLGKIPTSWNPIPLKFLVATRKGIAFKSSDFIDSGCKVVKASDIKNNTILDSAFFIDESFKSLFAKAILQKEEIVISTVGSNPDVKNSAVGQVGVVPEYLGESLLNQNTVVFTSKFSTSIQNRFLFYVLISTPYRDHLDLHAHGTANQASLNITDMLSFQIALPSIEEQRSIARFLDYKTAQIDALITKKETLLKKLAEKRTALISQAVTKGCDRAVPMKDSGIEWLGEIPYKWLTNSLKFLVVTRKGIAFKSNDFTDTGCRVVRASDIKNYTILESTLFLDERFKQEFSKAILKVGEIVISTVGSTPDVKNSAVGQVGIVPENLDQSLLNQNTVVFTQFDRNKLLNKFLFYILVSTAYRDHLDLYAHGTANQASLNIIDMLAFKIPLPLIEEQQLIVQFLDEEKDRIDQQKTKVEEAIAKLKEYRTALITNAVTGKIDVRDVMLEPEPVEAA